MIKKMTFEDILEKEDPTELYTNLKGIGQGAVGQIFSAIEKKNPRTSSNQRNGFETFPKRSITCRNGNHETIKTSQRGFFFWGIQHQQQNLGCDGVDGLGMLD